MIDLALALPRDLQTLSLNIVVLSTLENCNALHALGTDTAALYF